MSDEGILTDTGIHSLVCITVDVCDYNQYPQIGACQKSDIL